MDQAIKQVSVHRGIALPAQQDHNGTVLRDWYYVKGSDEVGPFSKEELQSLLARGEIGPDTMVRKRTWMEWERAASVKVQQAHASVDDTRISKVMREAKCVVRVTLADGSAREYIDNDIRESMCRDIAAGLLPMGSPTKKLVLVKGNHVCTLGTLRAIAKSMLSLDCLYRPVWAHALRGAKWGAITGACVKLLETTVELFLISPLLGFLMVAALAGCFIPKINSYVLVGLILFSIATGAAVNVYMAILAAALCGGLLGLLPGMAVGGLIGLIRANWLPRAKDAEPERGIPILTAFLLPAVGGVALTCFYLLWLNPMLLSWLAK